MLVRAVLAFIALPGMVAFVIPICWLWAAGRTTVIQPFGLVPLILGAIALLGCVRDFLVHGKGTLAPWSPTANLMVIGLYRFTRNPMYVAVILILIGWAISFGLVGLYAYAGIVAVAFHLRVVFGEEPWLARTHGAQWDEYSRKVPRWFW